MDTVKLGEADGGIKPRRPLLAHSSTHRMKLHVGTNLRRLQMAMASVTDSGAVKIAIPVLCLLIGLVFGMFGFWLKEQAKDIEYNRDVALTTASRVTALENRQVIIEEINRRLGAIESELRRRP